ncbi:MAG: cell wall hydrolase [Pseudomonadota bacterium]
MKIALAAAPLILLLACATPEEEPEVGRASSDTFEASAFECLREAIYFEAHASNPNGQHAVADVIKNRKRDPRFPNTVCGVISDRCQFSYRCDGRPETFPDKIKFRNATAIAREALANPQEDITKGALFFHAARMAPGWFGTLVRTGSFGGNIFYRG